MLLFYFKNAAFDKKYILLAFKERIDRILLSLQKIINIPDVIGKAKWEKLLIEFEDIKANSQSLENLKRCCQSKNFAISKFFPEMEFSFNKFVNSSKKKKNFTKALKIINYEIKIKSYIF